MHLKLKVFWELIKWVLGPGKATDEVIEYLYSFCFPSYHQIPIPRWVLRHECLDFLGVFFFLVYLSMNHFLSISRTIPYRLKTKQYSRMTVVG